MITILGSTLGMCWFISNVRTSYLDRHLRRFEFFNQFVLTIACIFSVLFTDHVYWRHIQYDIGYVYSIMLMSYNVICLVVCLIYAGGEPCSTWLRLRNMRLHQIQLAQELRACLIREAKERKEIRKQKKLKAFNEFRIDIGADIDDGERKEVADELDLAEALKPGVFDRENMIPDDITNLDSEDDLGEITDDSDGDGGELHTQLRMIPNSKNGLHTIKEETIEGTFDIAAGQKENDAGALNDLDSIFARAGGAARGPSEDYGLDDFDEQNYTETVDKLSLMDRERYLELQKQKHRLQRMRADLVQADLDDAGLDLKASAANAWNINERYNKIVARRVLKKERDRL